MIPGIRIFKMPRSDDVVKMLRADLADAGIVYRDDSGRVVDFHALRHSFISNLVAAGVYPETAQTLARHSSVTFTFDRYSHSCRKAESAAFETPPDLSHDSRQARRATGTENAKAAGNDLASSLALNE